MRSSPSCVSFTCAVITLLALPDVASARPAYCFPGPPAASAGVITGQAASCRGDGDAIRHAIENGVSQAQADGSAGCQALLSGASGFSVCNTQNMRFH